jgi:D-beta-D-heptose 7-phosphate kinase / D-beta-D-heptose 1-phosphate adenosyltransferase
MDLSSKLKNVKVLVVGDVMLDRYWWGSVTRISPEAPVPVVRLNKTTLAPGGAGNVAANIAALGASPLLLGCVGNDSEAEELNEVMSTSNVSTAELLRDPTRRTIVKTRVIAHSQQVARIDQESIESVSEETCEAARTAFGRLLQRADVVAFSDYAKGFLSDQFVSELIAKANEKGVPSVVDPKGRDYAKYRGASLLTPNRHEAALACNLDEGINLFAEQAGALLLDNYGFDAVLITEGECGMTLMERGNGPAHLEATAREVFDVTGAGDTVIAVIAACLGAGIDIRQSAELANLAAGIAVEKVGTVAVSIESIQAALDESVPDRGNGN